MRQVKRTPFCDDCDLSKDTNGQQPIAFRELQAVSKSYILAFVRSAVALKAMNKAICTVYRSLFRNARQLQAAGQNLEVRPPLDKEAWQSTKHSWVVNDPGMLAQSIITVRSCLSGSATGVVFTASRTDVVDQALPDLVQVIGQSSTSFAQKHHSHSSL